MKVNVVEDEEKTIYKLVAYVESETTQGVYYKVTHENGVFSCTCPDHRHRKSYCKHMEAVQFRE